MITKKEFDKLPQLSRIEFIIRMDRIRKKFSGSFTLNCLWCLLIATGFIILITPSWITAFGLDSWKELMQNMILPYILFALIFLGSLVADMILLIMEGRIIRDVNKEFFDSMCKQQEA
jgi:hypothetical protein